MSEQVNHPSDLPEAEAQKYNTEAPRRSWFHSLISGIFALTISEQGKVEDQEHNHEDTLAPANPPSRDITTTASGSDPAEVKETEAENKGLVKRWQSGHDTLLVSAGLSVGILIAFLI